MLTECGELKDRHTNTVERIEKWKENTNIRERKLLLGMRQVTGEVNMRDDRTY